MIAENKPSPDWPPVEMWVETDPVEIAAARARHEKFRRNSEWFKAHATEIYRTHRGKTVCVAGQELFVADTPQDAIALAKASHPEDEGRMTRIIPLERLERINAHRWRVVSL